MATQSKNKGNQEGNYSEEEKSQKAAQKEETKNVDAQDNAPDIESVIEFFHGDITEVESEAGIDSIDEWVDFLKGHKEEGIKELSASLKQLKKLLKAKNADAGEIAEVLNQLGEQTNAIGDDAERGVKGPLHKLGKALISSSHKVEKFADTEDEDEEDMEDEDEA
jgi:hypothetical protein